MRITAFITLGRPEIEARGGRVSVAGYVFRVFFFEDKGTYHL
jgi:hypothetical protein